MSGRRIAGIAIAAACAIGIGYEYYHATDFPTNAPITRVDAPLVAWLREHPGVHLALGPDAVMDVALDFREDSSNRTFYGTAIDLREAVPRNGIHIQRKGDRGAIHADAWVPTAGLLNRFMHGVVDVPVIPMIVGLILGIVLARSGRSRRSEKGLQ